jgi:LysM repeat protein
MITKTNQSMGCSMKDFFCCLIRAPLYSFLTIFLLNCFVALVIAHPCCADIAKSSLERTLHNIKYSQETLEQELARLDQKIQNQDLVLESTRDEVTSLLKACRESQKSLSSSQDSRLKALDKNIEKLIQDLKQFKTHANETSTFQSGLQKKLQGIDEIVRLQGEQLQDLEKAMRSLALAISSKPLADTKNDKKEQGTANKVKTYRVKSGDSLEKIAKDQGITVQALKEINALPNDKIISGQELKIP